jgi:SAM-dependent methyltransferase
MKLTRLGKLALNSPTRAFVQRHAVAPLLERLGGRVDGGTALEVGCGRGVGAEIIVDRFRAAEFDAIDIDPDMVERARRGLSERAGVRVSIGDGSRIAAPDRSFDAIFDFGAIHQMRLGLQLWRRSAASSRPAAASSSRRWRARFCGGRCGLRSRAGLPRGPARSRGTLSSASCRGTNSSARILPIAGSSTS